MVRYRGHDVLQLAAAETCERVAALLWTGSLHGALPDAGKTRLSARCRQALPFLSGLPPLNRFQVLLSLAAADDLAAYDLQPDAVAATGSRIIRLLLATAGGGSGKTIPEALARTIGWIGQIMEQYEAHRLIRPRARYTGPPPGKGAAEVTDGH